ncbi:MAG: hypothetical protein AMXMBFR47_41450 [Planctomycetota bacterium]
MAMPVGEDQARGGWKIASWAGVSGISYVGTAARTGVNSSGSTASNPIDAGAFAQQGDAQDLPLSTGGLGC